MHLVMSGGGLYIYVKRIRWTLYETKDSGHQHNTWIIGFCRPNIGHLSVHKASEGMPLHREQPAHILSFIDLAASSSYMMLSSSGS